METTFLSGKVRKNVLAVYDGPIPLDAPSLKRMQLPQGELAQLYDDDPGIRFIAYIELKEGTARGNHFHRVKEEFVYLLSGEVCLVVEDIESKIRESIPIQPGEMVFINTGVAHALQIVRSGQAIEFSTARFNAKDTFRYALS